MKQILMNNRIKVLCLALVLVFAGMCFGVGGAYAHYENQVSQQKVYGNEEDVYVWGFLENITQAAPSSFNTTNAVTTTMTESIATESATTENMTTTTTVEKSAEAVRVIEISNSVEVLRYPADDGIAVLALTPPSGCDVAVFRKNNGSFPIGTVYSTDGKNGKALNAAGSIQLDTTQSNVVLLQVLENTEVDIYYFSNGTLHSHDNCYVELIANTNAWSVALQEAQPVLGAGGGLTWSILGDSEKTTYDVQVQYLLADGYVDITQGYPLIVTQDASQQTITVTNSETQNALAGTYRMRITCNYKVSDNQTICLQTLEVPFFVNYR